MILKEKQVLLLKCFLSRLIYARYLHIYPVHSFPGDLSIQTAVSPCKLGNDSIGYVLSLTSAVKILISALLSPYIYEINKIDLKRD